MKERKKRFCGDKKFLSFRYHLAMKVHVSENTKILLDEFGGFILEKRGNIEIKVEKLSSLATTEQRLTSFSISHSRAKAAWTRSGLSVTTNSHRQVNWHRWEWTKFSSQFSSRSFSKIFENVEATYMSFCCAFVVGITIQFCFVSATFRIIR